MSTNLQVLQVSPTSVDLDPTQPSERELEFRSFIREHLFGQPEAETMAMDAYVACVSPLPNTDGPLFTAMSLGGSRSGKSLLPRLFAKFFHGDERNLVRINLSLYKQPHQIMQLIGAPPSYIGFDKPVKLSRAYMEAKRGKGKTGPIFVVLEEIDKAHPDVADFLMGIYDNGVQELANGDEVDYRDVIFFMTSNLAADQIALLGKPGIGFNRSEGHIPTPEEIKDTVYAELTKVYRPEFLNRIGQVVIYRELTREDVRKITEQEVKLFQQHILNSLDRNLLFVLSVEDSAIDFMLAEAYQACEKINKTKTGHASPVAELKRVISEFLKRPITRELIKKTVGCGDMVTVSFVEGNERLSFRNNKAVPQAKTEQVTAPAATEQVPASGGNDHTSDPVEQIVEGSVPETNDKSGRLLQPFTVSMQGNTRAAVANAKQKVLEAMEQSPNTVVVKGEEAYVEPFVAKFVVHSTLEDIAALGKQFPFLHIHIVGGVLQ